MGKSNLISLLKGNFTGKTLKLYILINYSIAIVFLFLATITLHLESGFSFLDDDISATGSIGGNPTGWYFFSIFLVYGGLFMVPICIFYNKAMKTLGYKARFMVTIFYTIGCIGTAMVGFFPSGTIREMHLVSAILAFGGYGFGFIIYFFISIYRKRWKFLRPYLIFFPIIAGLLITQGYVLFTAEEINLSIFDSYRGTFLSISLWEWLLFFSIVFMFVSKAIMLATEVSGKGSEV